MTTLAPSDIDAIRLSLKVAVAATLLALPFACVTAYFLAWRRFGGKLFIETAVNLPLSLPPVVVGYLLLLLLGKNGWLGGLLAKLDIRILFTWKAAVIASMVVGFPLMVRSIRLSMEGIEKGVVHAARTLGATRLDTFFSIILPLSWKGIVAGSSLMFARSLGEFGATIIVAGNIPGVTQTIPLAIYDYAASPGGEQAAGMLCIVSIVISLLALFFHEWLARKIRRRR